MKKLVASSFMIFILFSSCILRTTGCSESHFKESESESFVQGYKVSKPVNLKISTSGGSITTIGSNNNNNNDSIEVSFIVTERGKVLDIDMEGLKKIAEVEIANDKSSLEINIIKIYERNISVGFSIKTPNNTSADLVTSGGNISLTDLIGRQSINTSGGNMNFKNIFGDVNAHTSGGYISLDNVNGKTNISTSGGNINASTIKPSLIAQTSGGNIDLKKIQGLVDVYTSGGSIHLNEISGSIKAFTSGGKISADIIRLSEKLELGTSGGNISASLPAGLGLDLDLSADKIETPLNNFTGFNKEGRIKGQMNGGGIPVNISTSGGHMMVTYK